VPDRAATGRRCDLTVAEPHPFHLSNDLAAVPPLRVLFSQACVAAGVADEEREGQTLVFTELVNNAIEHGCTRPTDCVDGWFQITEAAIEIEVTDPSKGLTNEDFTSSDASGFAETGRGAGLFLIQALTDEISVRRAPAGGTTVCTVKHLHGGGGA
jgi:anti-sigma regulatory factor (Ser/Thr protein kinase)